MKAKFLILLLACLMSSNALSKEIIIGQCQDTSSVISKLIGLESGGGNEFMHMLAKDGSEAILIHTYNPKIEKYKGVIAENDSKFFYYDYKKCKYRFDGEKKQFTGYFFVNKRDIIDNKKEDIFREKSRQNVSYIGRVYTFSEAHTLFYGLKTNNGEDILLGGAFEYSGTESDNCLRESDEKGTNVKISGELVTFVNKEIGSTMDAKTVYCLQIK